MKKKSTIIIIGAFLLFISTASILFYINYSPLNKFDFTNCKIGIYNYDCSEIVTYLSQEEQANFLDLLLNQIDLSGFGSEPEMLTGGSGGYLIEFENGETLMIANRSSGNPTLLVGEKWYLANSYELLSELDEFKIELYKQIYPVWFLMIIFHKTPYLYY